MAHTLVFTNYKGGVSKTTSVLNISASLASRKKKVLVLDLDPQHNLTQALGIKEFSFGVYHSLVEKKDILPIEINKYLFIAPGQMELEEAQEIISGRMQREYSLIKSLKNIKNDFDYILIDCPPSLGLLTFNGIMAADIYMVPVEPEALARNGLFILSNKLKEIEGEIDHIFFTKCDISTKLHQSIINNIVDKFPGKILNTRIRKNIRLAETPIAEQDIFEYDKNSHGAIDYKELTDEIVKLYN